MCCFTFIGHSPPAQATPLIHPPLTLEILQQRLQAPVMIDGQPTLDLRQFQIDLRPEQNFREPFYQGLAQTLQRPGKTWGLDLSDAVILGDWQFQSLGLRLPLTGQALTPNFSPPIQTQFDQDRRRLFQLSRLSRSLLSRDYREDDLQLRLFRGPIYLNRTQFQGNLSGRNTFFLAPIQARDVDVLGSSDWSSSRFAQAVTWSGSRFNQNSIWRGTIFFSKANFSATRWQASTDFSVSEFQDSANFSRASFSQSVTFSRSQWQGSSDFSQTRWAGLVTFNHSQWQKALFFPETVFSQVASFRNSQFNGTINLRGASILTQLDLSDAQFNPPAQINSPDLEFDAKSAQILGTPGTIGKVFTVPGYRNHQGVLRNLIRNFRQLEQIQDANAIELMGQLRHWQELGQGLGGRNLNRLNTGQLARLGLNQSQISQLLSQRQDHPFTDLTDLLSRNVIDLATYVKLEPKVTVAPVLSPSAWLTQAWQWLGLSLLLAFTAYGSQVGLIFGVGLVAIAYFALVFWGIDRIRRWRPTPILPTPTEILVMTLGGLGLGLVGGQLITSHALNPGLTWLWLAWFLLPVPLTLTAIIYWRGRYHDLITISYFVEDGSQRQLRLLIGRLPIMPRFPFFRDRYEPILWNRRWTGLNYFDLSLINFLKFGFNDIRLRDQHLPGLVGSLVWYQWGLGLPYIGLLLWTLSRTIPGLNLFIYF